MIVLCRQCGCRRSDISCSGYRNIQTTHFADLLIHVSFVCVLRSSFRFRNDLCGSHFVVPGKQRYTGKTDRSCHKAIVMMPVSPARFGIFLTTIFQKGLSALSNI